MVKNAKKRSASEGEVVGKLVEESANLNKALKKKKVENGAVQNGQTSKEVKKDASKKLVTEKKKNQGDKGEATQNLKAARQLYRQNRKARRQQKVYHGVKPDLSSEELKQKIQNIEKRDNLTKTAKRKLASLKKILAVRDGTYKPKQEVSKKKADKSVEVAKKKQVQNTAEQKKKLPEKLETKSNKDNKKKNVKQGNLLLVKQNESDDEEEEDEEVVETDEEVSEDEDDSDLEAEEEEEVEEVEEEEEDDDDDDEDEDQEVEDEDDDEDDEDDEDEKNDETKTNNVQSPKVKGKPTQNTEQEGKKKRYVLFVGNLPYTITNEELKKHFLTKVSQVVDIRIPKKDANTARGFAYVELANNTDYERALSLNHSFVNGRRINVQYSGPTGNRKEVVAKNFKLQALQKAGKLAGGQNRNNQKYAGKKPGRQNMHMTKT